MNYQDSTKKKKCHFARTIVKMQHKVSVKFGHGHFGQIRFLMKKVLKIVYINNIYYLYILSLGEKLFFYFDFDRNDHDRI